MFGEAVMLATSSTSATEISTYVAVLGGVAAVARLLGVPPQRVRRWQQGEQPPREAWFFLDEAYCATVVALSVDDLEAATVR